MRELAEAVHGAGALLAVDNTVATALGQRPLDHGADIVMTSLTKSTTGHHDVLLGSVTTRDAARVEALRSWRTASGAIPGTFEAWLAHRSLATLDVRLERTCANAQAVAELLAARDDVPLVRYPGLASDPGHAIRLKLHAAGQVEGIDGVHQAEDAGRDQVVEVDALGQALPDPFGVVFDQGQIPLDEPVAQGRGGLLFELPPEFRHVHVELRWHPDLHVGCVRGRGTSCAKEERTSVPAPVASRSASSDGVAPVVLALVYYSCPMLCNQILNGVLGSLRQVSFNAGEQFEVIAVSFDPRETSELAATKKQTYVKAYNRPGAENGWHFLTGDEANIKRVTEAAGFHYKWDEKTNQFAHASGIMIAA